MFYAMCNSGSQFLWGTAVKLDFAQLNYILKVAFTYQILSRFIFIEDKKLGRTKMFIEFIALF